MRGCECEQAEEGLEGTVEEGGWDGIGVTMRGYEEGWCQGGCTAPSHHQRAADLSTLQDAVGKTKGLCLRLVCSVERMMGFISKEDPLVGESFGKLRRAFGGDWML